MGVLVVRKPFFWMECFCLCYGLEPIRGEAYRKSWAYLSHSAKHLLATPFREAPIVVVLLHPSNADGAVGAAAPTQEPASGKSALLAI